ncbi:MAG: tripartite tricarboxylate transporter permease [Candidatus Micrarchaeota archaeon]|nr:tripartite tricarboxylate transporter permease [Candidatus Micrarchaeota archaeon]
MFLEIALGIALGTFSGLLPGIHANTVASILTSLPIEPSVLFYILVATMGAHLVVQFFPSIFFSIPDDTVALSVLPGHRMALEGRGKEAIIVCLSSLFGAFFLALLAFPVATEFFPLAYKMIKPHIAFLLVLASIILIWTESEFKKAIAASFVFLLTGAIGIATFIGQINEPLFPAFAGLFAASGILLSFGASKPPPKQKEVTTNFDYAAYIIVGAIFGMLSDLLPGIAAPAQIAVFASLLLPVAEPRKFLALVSAIASAHTVFAFAALVTIGKAREGTIAMINEVYPITSQNVPIALGILLVSIGVSSIILTQLAKHAQRFLQNSKMLNLLVIIYLVFSVWLISGPLGMLLFAVCTAAGVLPPLLGIRRTHLMGIIIVPSILASI